MSLKGKSLDSLDICSYSTFCTKWLQIGRNLYTPMSCSMTVALWEGVRHPDSLHSTHKRGTYIYMIKLFAHFHVGCSWKKIIYPQKISLYTEKSWVFEMSYYMSVVHLWINVEMSHPIQLNKLFTSNHFKSTYVCVK